MNNFTFLTGDQYFDNQISIIKKRGTKAAVTDFAILLGAYVSDNYYVDNSNQTLADRTGWYWTSSDDNDNDARVVGISGNEN